MIGTNSHRIMSEQGSPCVSSELIKSHVSSFASHCRGIRQGAEPLVNVAWPIAMGKDED